MDVFNRVVEEDKIKQYNPKGYWKFVYKDSILQSFPRDYPSDLLEMYSTYICGTIMSGKEFYEYVDEGYFIDSDGSLSKVFVNGYLSNLGLYHKGMSQGRFLVDGPTWLHLCDKYDIEVEWCNK